MGEPLEIFLTVVVMSFWFVFTIGMSLSVSKLGKGTDSVVQLGALDDAILHPPEPRTIRIPVKVQRRPAWRPHVASIHFRRGIRH
ncbi:MAG TPA: hypothetical protein VNJ08_14705 [Bacteriovoracaceae bacterium]|nr:hypothetical protein [Bacteriovoracaceae bacterium]